MSRFIVLLLLVAANTIDLGVAVMGAAVHLAVPGSGQVYVVLGAGIEDFFALAALRVDPQIDDADVCRTSRRRSSSRYLGEMGL